MAAVVVTLKLLALLLHTVLGWLDATYQLLRSALHSAANVL